MDRNNRRRQRAGILGSAGSHPVSRRLLYNYEKYGQIAAEIYTQNDDGSGKPRYFDVFSTRLWCDKNKRIEPLSIDARIVAELRSNGSIDVRHLELKIFDQDVAPVIFLQGASTEGGLLLDGTHRYVAFAEELQKQGLEEQIRAVPAYILNPTEWKRFVVPPAVAKAFRFDEHTASVDADP